MNISLAIISSFMAILLSNPAIAWAEGRQLTYTLDTQGGHSYQAVMQQAGSLAQKLIEQEFTQNSQTQEVEVVIVGERNGQEVPLLSAKVSHSNWRENPRIQSWTQYFSDSAVLLGFKQGRTRTNAVQPEQNSYVQNKEVAVSHLEPNFYK